MFNKSPSLDGWRKEWSWKSSRIFPWRPILFFPFLQWLNCQDASVWISLSQYLSSSIFLLLKKKIIKKKKDKQNSSLYHHFFFLEVCKRFLTKCQACLSGIFFFYRTEGANTDTSSPYHCNILASLLWSIQLLNPVSTVIWFLQISTLIFLPKTLSCNWLTLNLILVPVTGPLPNAFIYVRKLNKPVNPPIPFSPPRALTQSLQPPSSQTWKRIISP